MCVPPTGFDLFGVLGKLICMKGTSNLKLIVVQHLGMSYPNHKSKHVRGGLSLSLCTELCSDSFSFFFAHVAEVAVFSMRTVKDITGHSYVHSLCSVMN